jgi:hypothetical protein
MSTTLQLSILKIHFSIILLSRTTSSKRGIKIHSPWKHALPHTDRNKTCFRIVTAVTKKNSIAVPKAIPWAAGPQCLTSTGIYTRKLTYVLTKANRHWQETKWFIQQNVLRTSVFCVTDYCVLKALATTGLGKGCNYRRELILLVTRIGSKNFEVRLSFIYISTICYSRDRLKDLTIL